MKTRFTLRKKQRGVAAIWLALVLVPVMGFTFLSVEGTRYIQTSSRLHDSLEAAAIAVTIADFRDDDTKTDELAQRYVNAYLRGIKNDDIVITSILDYQEWSEGTPEHIQYTVGATTSHKSWFASQLIPSFDETQKISGQSMAKKYPVFLGDNNIDLMFVSDFSGSMARRWGSKNSYKIDDLKSAVRGIAEALLCHEIKEDECEVGINQMSEVIPDRLDNRIGVVPFNIRTREVVDSKIVAASQLEYKNDVYPEESKKNYTNVNWNGLRKNNLSDLNNKSEQKKRAYHVLTSSNNKYPDNENYVDYSLTVENLLVNKVTVKLPDSKSRTRRTYYRVDNTTLYQGYGNVDKQFENIELTNDIITLLGVKLNGDEHNAYGIYDMSAAGSTAAFQGMLRGFQLLAAGKPDKTDDDELEAYDNKLKMLFVLTDGQESPNNSILPKLVSAHMCDKARELIPGLFIGVIGIDFKASAQSGYQQCVVEADEDIIDVTNLEQLKESINDLISRGATSNGATQLY